MQARFTKPMAALAISAAVIVGTMGVSAASVDAKGSKKKFCTASSKVGSDVDPSTDPSGISEDTAADLEKAFKKLAKSAPNNSMKKAVLTISAFYGRFADGDAPGDVAQDDGVAYAKAAAKFGTYVATKCIAVLIPDVTIPDIKIP